MSLIQKIVSGDQTGVDRGTLDAALANGTPCGWCPGGRRAEDGTIPERYPLRPTPESDPTSRTELNLLDSDGTLVLTPGPITGGTAHTIAAARNHHRPLLITLMQPTPDPAEIARWLINYNIRILNVAAPRESHAPGIQEQTSALLDRLVKWRWPPAE